MVNFNVFIENACCASCIDEVKVYNDILKISSFIFSENSVIKNSCLKNYNYTSISFDIVFVNNDEIQKINKEYRKKDSPTDVITFAIFADSDEKFIIDGDISLGEIIVSVDKIYEQSKENNVSFDEELYYIAAHGILHLLGFDHNTDKDYEFMVELQNKSKELVV